MLFLALVAAAAAHAQERADCRVFKSAILHSSVRYCVFLPASYAAPQAQAQRYPVLYLLQGSGETRSRPRWTGNGTRCRICGATTKRAIFWWWLRTGGTRFTSIRATARRCTADFFLREFMPFIERTYRVQSGRASHAITGFSMGGYGALRIAFAHPEMFGSVSAHSAALMREPPMGVDAGASSGNPAAQLLTKVFGNPIDRKFWNLNSPFVLAKQNAALLSKMKIYFDCGTEDSFGFYTGASQMNQALDVLKIPHEFHLYPGGHSVSYLLAHRDASFLFHWQVFESARK